MNRTRSGYRRGPSSTSWSTDLDPKRELAYSRSAASTGRRSWSSTSGRRRSRHRRPDSGWNGYDRGSSFELRSSTYAREHAAVFKTIKPKVKLGVRHFIEGDAKDRRRPVSVRLRPARLPCPRVYGGPRGYSGSFSADIPTKDYARLRRGVSSSARRRAGDSACGEDDRFVGPLADRTRPRNARTGFCTELRSADHDRRLLQRGRQRANVTTRRFLKTAVATSSIRARANQLSAGRKSRQDPPEGLRGRRQRRTRAKATNGSSGGNVEVSRKIRPTISSVKTEQD